MNRLASPLLWAGLWCAAACAARGDDEAGELIARVRAVGAQGTGSAQARAARDALVAKGADILPYLLIGMDTPDTVAANWLRTAFDEIVARALEADPSRIPADEFEKFVRDPGRQGRARRLALGVLARLDEAAPQRILPPLLDDPEFRRDAVAIALATGDRATSEKRTDAARAAYAKAFQAARDADQVRETAAKLHTLGVEVSIIDHLGFLIDWFLIGPFDGPDFSAFTRVYPPERAIDLGASYAGKAGPVAWKRYRTPDDFGTVDLVKALGATDDAAAYAYTTLESPRARDAQLRTGADDNITIWVNGDKVFAKEEWQNGTRLDRFVVPIHLRQGTNELVLKICQGPPYQDPGLANLWSFQIRLCDRDGRGIAGEERGLKKEER